MLRGLLVPGMLALGQVEFTQGLEKRGVDRIGLATEGLNGLNWMIVVVLVTCVQDHLLVTSQDRAGDDLPIARGGRIPQKQSKREQRPPFPLNCFHFLI